jgi:hypothetical protein
LAGLLRWVILLVSIQAAPLPVVAVVEERERRRHQRREPE